MKLYFEYTLATLRLYWRVVYRHMTRLEIEGTHFYSPVVCKDLCREIMSSILAYQSERRTFYLSRRYTSRPEVLPTYAVSKVASLGDLDVHTGTLSIKQELVDLLLEYDSYTNFNWAEDA